MTRRLFVAGPSSIRLQVREIIDDCTAAGWEITEDWTRCTSWDQPLSEEVLRAANRRNHSGVARADAVLYLCHDLHPSAGAAHEARVAWDLGKHVVVLWLDKSRHGGGACYALHYGLQAHTLTDALALFDHTTTHLEVAR